MSSNKKLIVHCDGGSRGNPGQSALGVYFDDFNKGYGEYLGIGTNNEAEYRAVIFALKKARQLVGKDKAERLEIAIRADSELLVKQLNGEYKLRSENLFPLFIEIWNLKQDYNKVEFVYVPREQNKKADALVNEALDAKGLGKQSSLL